MLTSKQLQALARDLGDVAVLSVYVDARVTDPAMRHAWRAALGTALRAARAGLDDPLDRAAFDAAASYLGDAMPRLDGAWGAPGWVAFVTAAGRRYAAALPVRVPTMAVWRHGPLLSPYLRALKQRCPVTVALVDSRSVRLYRYAMGELSALDEMTLPASAVDRAGAGRPSDVRGTSYTAPRSAPAGERAWRRQRADFQRLATMLARRLVGLAGDDGWILIGGTPAWARIAAESLPSTLADRTLVSVALDRARTEQEIARAAKDAATTLRAARGAALLDQLLERAAAAGRATAGVPATLRALRAHAVDVLLLSPAFVRTHAAAAEEAVRAALAQGARAEVLSGDAALQLDRDAGGIASRLRFAPGTREAREAGGSRNTVHADLAASAGGLDNSRCEEYP